MNMKTCGIIAEYNPFHQGHIYHIQKTKELTQCDCLIAIVSNHFTQRGLFNLLTMEDKTKLALEAGCNLVIELPPCYAAQSADYFAKYAVESLSQLHIDQICFGSETNNISTLKEYSKQMESTQVVPSLSMNQNLYTKNIRPNDILGIQYIKQCEKYGITPCTIARNDSFKSATQTRKEYFDGISQFNDAYFNKNQTWDTHYPYLRKFLLLSDTNTLSTYFLVNEGIEYRLKENAKKYQKWQDFLMASISKTYTKARIQRTCMFILLQIKKAQMQENNHFNQVIVSGFDSVGQEFLKGKQVITKFKELPKFLQDIELKCQYLSFDTFKARKVMYYDR